MASVDLRATVEVTVNDEEAITRCGTPEWRDVMYDLPNRESVLAHWAYNTLCNGTVDACSLEGWADLNPGVVTMRVVGVEVEDVRR